MKMLFIILLVLISLGATTACYYDNELALYGEEVCSPEPATYSGTVSVIIQNNCLTCHSQAIATGGIMLETYAQVKAHASNGKLVGVVTHSNGFSPMPKDRPQLSNCNINAIRQWVEAGALND